MAITTSRFRTTLGFGSSQLGAGLEQIGWISQNSFALQVGVIVVVMCLAMFSAISGVGKGVKILSEINKAVMIEKNQETFGIKKVETRKGKEEGVEVYSIAETSVNFENENNFLGNEENFQNVIGDFENIKETGIIENSEIDRNFGEIEEIDINEEIVDNQEFFENDSKSGNINDRIEILIDNKDLGVFEQ